MTGEKGAAFRKQMDRRVRNLYDDSQTAMIFSFGEYQLDLSLYELRAAGERRAVEPQVFDVLAYLIRNRDRVVTKGELLEKLWADRFVSEATLTSRLMAARKALGDSARKQEWIKTVHGRGYRFVGEVGEVSHSLPISGSETHAPSGEFVVRADTRPESGFDPLRLGARCDVSGLLVGREKELETLHDAFDKAAGGERQIVFVTGEAGAGKTTLVDAFVSSLPLLRPRVGLGQCLEHRGSGEAYLPVLEALERLCLRESESPVEVAPILRKLAPTWASQMPCLGVEGGESDVGEASRERMLREMATSLEAIAAEAPLLLVLEDVHWSDYSTLDLVTSLARRREPARLMIILTYRPADVKAARHPIYALTQELRIRGQCRVIALPLLEPSEIERYVAAKLPGAQFGPLLASMLHQRTAGNPLFVRTLIEYWLQLGLIRRAADGWRIEVDQSELVDSVPDTLGHLIEQHVSDIPPLQQQILEAGSVAGREFSAATAAAALGSDEAEVEHLCAALAREGRFLRSLGSELWPDGTVAERFTFTHDLYQDVLYARLPAGSRARPPRAIGLRIEKAWAGHEREHAAELAHHFTRGGDHTRAVHYQNIAAGQALRRSAHHEAIDHLDSALEALAYLPKTADRDRSELWICSRLAPSIIATRGWGEPRAEEMFLRARELARALGEAGDLSTIIYGLANMYEFRGDFEKAESLMQERLEIANESDPMTLLETHELLTCSLMHQARYAESLVHAGKARKILDQVLARGEPPASAGIQSCGWASAAMMFKGLSDTALASAEELHLLASRSPDDLARAIGYLQVSFIHYHRREAAKASHVAEEGIAIGLEQRYPFVVGVGRVLRGWCAAHMGRALESALGEIRGGLRTCRLIGARMDYPLFLCMHADVALRAGKPLEARAAMIEAVTMIEERSRAFFYTPEVWRVRGLIAESLDHDPLAASDWYRRALRLAREQRSPILALRTATSLVRLVPEEWPVLEQAIESMSEGANTPDFQEAADLIANARA
jgi:DNA-binding winged helix-turn-helix (wHTH) protein/tetratricopeptide (TPR) repeat protein